MSKSTTYQSRKSDLEQKEKLLLSDMNEKGDKVKQIVKWSLLAGLVALLGFGLYKSFANSPSKKKKKNKSKTKKDSINLADDNKMLDSVITYGSPILGNWLLNQLGKKETDEKN